ncbi:hypothetical protein Pse7367_3282 [Thalassoporum mexicanum PCC 7367]|uniref:DUF4327 family protein n=1 Tax=Thalassoporum mexicanum TaxID=3457544 RepID=UPI00029F9258|nr:DUF4327 family protein [Pseudanabaena sp. PCC 7367]AFY71522.1 hypothetical protein Pse7367_3282 [Pseudanabaena sp. PCC 7367]
MNNTQVIHPMVKFQQQVKSLTDKKLVNGTDRLWQVSLVFGNDWQHWKNELIDFGFTMQDPIAALLEVEAWDDE